jgi:phospholipid/cholesterol/gamma-HCH transport system ATP-binding protein
MRTDAMRQESPRDVAQAPLELNKVWLAFGSRVVCRDLSCSFPRGAITVLMGGSGAGKSTLFRLIGGLLRPDRGSIKVAGEEITGLSESGLGRVRRRIGMMFQGGALLDSMTLFQNVALPLRERTKLSEPEVAAKVMESLEAVGLADAEGLLPSQLSGGMVKRAALARAIVMSPEIVLADEPFSGLDPVTLRRIEALLVETNRGLGHTLVVASHHIASAKRMAHQIVFLRDGIAICGSPEELERSADPGIAEFFHADAGGPEPRAMHTEAR